LASPPVAQGRPSIATLVAKAPNDPGPGCLSDESHSNFFGALQ
jgi:hypothetical protein